MLEDSQLDADLIISRLRKANFSLEYVLTNTRDAFVANLHRHAYNIILCDYDVPGFSGLEALEIVRQHDDEVPFIFVSGALGEELAIDTLHRGATDYVLKQRLARLVPAVRRALGEVEERSARLHAEAQARENEERFRMLTDFMPQMVWALDIEGKLSYSNPAWQQHMPADATSWLDIRSIHEEDRVTCEELWTAVQAAQQPFSIECRYRTPLSDEYRWFLVHGVPFGPALENRRCWLGTATDVQEERQKAEVLRTAEKLAVAGRMAATIAHEINNPLESLVNLIFLLRQVKGLPVPVTEYLEIADNELERVSSIAKQTLTFYREPDEITAICAVDLLKEVVLLFSPRIVTKELQVRVEGDPSVCFYASKGEVRQVLINLIINALDAVSRQGTVLLHALEVDLNGCCFAEVRVEDDGPGIPPESIPHIFQPFFSTKGAQGTGLGLWVSKGIVEKFHGSMAIASHRVPDGRGRTTATVRLPCASPEDMRSCTGALASELN